MSRDHVTGALLPKPEPRPQPKRYGATAQIDGRAARRLHLQVGRRLDGLLQGAHMGLLPGPGTEPAEARRYLPGDDVRRIDWSVTARTTDTHVRDTVAERELEATLVVDLSSSMSFGTSQWEKRELAVSVAAAFAHLAAGPGDRVGAVVLTSDGVRRLPPRSGTLATLAMLHVLLATPRGPVVPPPSAVAPFVPVPGAATAPERARPLPGLADALAQVADPPRRRGLVVVISDLLDPPAAGQAPAWVAPLRRLAQRHDVVVAEIVDPRELTLPDVGVLRLVDPESGRELEVQTGSRKLRERYAAAAATLRAGHGTAIRAAGAGHVVLRTDQDWLRVLAAHLARRRRTRGVVR